MKTGLENLPDKAVTERAQAIKRRVFIVAAMSPEEKNTSGPKGEVPPAQAVLLSAHLYELFEAELRRRNLPVWEIDDPDDPCVTDLLELFDGRG